MLPTLHIKLGLAKQLVKALKSDSEAFKHVQAMFPKLSEAMVKGGIFTRPQIRQMLGSKELEGIMTALEIDAWQSFRNVMHNFLGRNKADSYEDLVETRRNFTANILQAWEQDVTKNALLPFSLRFFQAKFGRCERRVNVFIKIFR